MTRQKANISFIKNDSERKTCFKKRTNSLLKQAHELNVLCDVDVCVIVHSPFDQVPGIWPPSPEQVHKVIARFEELQEVKRSRWMLTPEEYARERTKKFQEQIKRTQRANRQKEVERFVCQCLEGQCIQNLNVFDLNDMGWDLTYKLRDVHEQIEKIRKQLPPLAPSKDKGKGIMLPSPHLQPAAHRIPHPQEKGKGKGIMLASPDMPAATDQMAHPQDKGKGIALAPSDISSLADQTAHPQDKGKGIMLAPSNMLAPWDSTMPSVIHGMQNMPWVPSNEQQGDEEEDGDFWLSFLLNGDGEGPGQSAPF